MNFSENLMRLRKQKGLSQEELGYELDVTRQTISKWELGETSPDLSKAKAIADYFGVSVNELVGYEEKTKEKKRFEYEYKSEKLINGVPLIHIHFGMGKYRAKGIVAIGNVASGVLSIGLFSAGLFSFGVLSLGLVSFGALALGLLLSLGGIALGGLAVGGIAVGILAVGGVALGYFSLGGLAVGVYSIGGFATARDIAYGGKAIATVAFSTNNGEVIFQAAYIRQTIEAAFPNISPIILDIFTFLGV